MEKKGIIFDLDGTMWDASYSNSAAWNIALGRHADIEKRITVKDIQGYMGKTIEEIATIALPDMDVIESVSILKECCKEEIIALRQHGGNLFPQLEETLSQLMNKYRLYIVSNCQDGYVQAFLDYHKLNQYFDDIEMAGRTGKGKAENIKIVVERNGLDKAVYVGDTDGDFNSSKEAGIPFVYAEYGFGNVEHPDYVIKSISELLDIVEHIL